MGLIDVAAVIFLFVVVVVFFWILCGTVAAVIANKKGRSAFGWFSLGIALGPIGIILALVVSKNQETPDKPDRTMLIIVAGLVLYLLIIAAFLLL